MGKAVAKDASRGKATLVALLGIDGATAHLAGLVAEAENALKKTDVNPYPEDDEDDEGEE